MRFPSLRNRLAWLFLSFFLLVSVSAAVTFWSLDAQTQDALLINLAGRQRMLVQQMTRLALEAGQAQEPGAPVVLGDARAMFEQSLAVLQRGGEAPYLTAQDLTVPAARQPQVRARLQRLEIAWQAFDAELDRLTQAPPGSPARSQAAGAITAQSGELLAQANAVVQIYQEAATAKIQRLRTLQIAFLVSALLLLALAGWLVRHWLLRPLQHLDRAAERIGADDLATPVQVAGPWEIALLSRTMEAMRARLQASRADLLQLTGSLEERVAQRTRELEALNQVSREISSQLHVQHVLDSVTGKARGLLGADTAALCLLDEGKDWLHLRSLSGPEDAVREQRMAAEQGVASLVLSASGALVCDNAKCNGNCHVLAETYRTSHLAAPLCIGDHVVGALCVGSPQAGRFADESVELLAKLANTAAVAFENARLYAQAERVATLEERSRIAAEMHDGLGQTLSYLGLMTDQAMEFVAAGQDEAALERLRKTRATIEQATGEVRRAIDHLLDETPAAPDLATRLQTLVTDFDQQTGLAVRWLPAVEALSRCSPEGTEQVLNIAQEALYNAARHAGAGAVTVRLERLNGHYLMVVEDDGRGFDPSLSASNGHFGLKIMRARAAHIDGRLQIDSAPGQGAQIRLAWPVCEEA